MGPPQDRRRHRRSAQGRERDRGARRSGLRDAHGHQGHGQRGRDGCRAAVAQRTARADARGRLGAGRAEARRWRHPRAGRRLRLLRRQVRQVQPCHAGAAPARVGLQTVPVLGGARERLHSGLADPRCPVRDRRYEHGRGLAAGELERRILRPDAAARGAGEIPQPRIDPAAAGGRDVTGHGLGGTVRLRARPLAAQPHARTRHQQRDTAAGRHGIRRVRERRLPRAALVHRSHRGPEGRGRLPGGAAPRRLRCRGQCGRREGLQPAGRAARAARHQRGECVADDRLHARSDRARHRRACSRTRPQRHRRQDRHHQRIARHLVQRLQPQRRRDRVGGLRSGPTARRWRGRQPHRGADLDGLHARRARRRAAARLADA